MGSAGSGGGALRSVSLDVPVSRPPGPSAVIAALRSAPHRPLPEGGLRHGHDGPDAVLLYEQPHQGAGDDDEGDAGELLQQSHCTA